jgi:hypothetical protein
VNSPGTQPNLLKLAKQGNPKAIAALMNRQLQIKGITAKVALKNSCLQVLLESAQVQNQQALVAFVRKGITSLGCESIKSVKVYGRQIGEEVPDWSQEFELEVQAISKASLSNQPLTTSVPTTDSKDTLKDLINTGANFLEKSITALGDHLAKETLEIQYEKFIYEKGHLFPKNSTGFVLSTQKSVYQKSINKLSKILVDFLSQSEDLLDVILVKFQKRDAFLLITNKRLVCFSHMPLAVPIAGESLKDSLKGANKFSLRFTQDIEKIVIANNGLIISQNSKDYELEHEIELSYVYTNIYDNLATLNTTLSSLTTVESIDSIVVSKNLAQNPANISRSDTILGCGCLTLIAALVVGGLSSLFYSFTKPHSASVETPVATSQSQSDNTPKASSNTCVKNFNRQMGAAADATLDKDTKTISITIGNETASGLTNSQFESFAEQAASSIFSSCSDTFIQTVSVSNGSYVVTKNR